MVDIEPPRSFAQFIQQEIVQFDRPKKAPDVLKPFIAGLHLQAVHLVDTNGVRLGQPELRSAAK